MLNVNVITLFPNIIENSLKESIPGRALNNNLWSLNLIDMRKFSNSKYKNVDDTPYGGGPGLVICAYVIDNALKSIENVGEIFYLSPRGAVFSQHMANKMSGCVNNASGKNVKAELNKNITFVCGRYEGIDQRVIEKWQMNEISIGDYILSGGELATCVILDSIIRLIPGAVGDKESLIDESFNDGLLEYHQYTRPEIWESKKVPKVLVSGNHKKIYEWKEKMKREITEKNRPDLWKMYKNNDIK